MKRALTRLDQHLFHEGTWARAFEKMGAHPGTSGGKRGTWFATWAPRAEQIQVIGDFNGWGEVPALLDRLTEGGLYQGFVPGARPGQRYKYRIIRDGASFDKADPWAQMTEVPPATASVIADEGYRWNDAAWMRARLHRRPLREPMSIYEVHPGSFLRPGGREPTWRELGPVLADHALAHGFTHIELLPVMEHPFYGSWGYQVTSYHAPSARYGSPADLMAMIDLFHQRGLGVLLDWTPAHFPNDAFALAAFDGDPLFEHPDPRRGFHPDWNTLIFDYGRPEVRTFLLSSAVFWLDRYHADGLRVDAVASMLYLDYSRPAGAWLPNIHGGRENLDAISFLQALNQAVHREAPGALVHAEESTAWPKVTGATEHGGLGFGAKWDMGWMHDTLAYLQLDPLHRKYHHDRITFRTVYAFAERFVLPLSHDEVVHGKGSLLRKMHGDPWQQRAHLRLLFAHQHASPGKKLLFMGGEIGQEREWAHEREVDWALMDLPEHKALAHYVARLNALHRQEPALHRGDCEEAGFRWVWGADAELSVMVFLRCDPDGVGPDVLVAEHFTPIPRPGYRVGVPTLGAWDVVLESDDPVFGGSGVTQGLCVPAETEPCHGFPYSVVLTLPPLGVVWLRAPTTR
jgi:1,4-alpha-glucan branching enzyme